MSFTCCRYQSIGSSYCTSVEFKQSIYLKQTLLDAGEVYLGLHIYYLGLITVEKFGIIYGKLSRAFLSFTCVEPAFQYYCNDYIYSNVNITLTAIIVNPT